MELGSNFNKSNRKRKRTRVAAVALAAALGTASCIPVAADAKIGDGVTTSCDEAYYATLDYYGNLAEGSVVKSYALNGSQTVVDYGNYDQIVNLTDDIQPSTADGKTVFQLNNKDVPDHFYFEGKTAEPFKNLPWTLSVSYKLNGVPTKAEDLAGESGMVEMNLDIVPNKNASDYAKNNYILTATTVFNQDDILSLKAEGAQVQMIGNLRLVMFMALPGEEEHFTIDVGANDFESDGITFLMVPATLSQLDQIAELSDRKEELKDDYDKLSDSLDTLLDSVQDMSGSLYATAGGLDELDQARGTISFGKGQIYSDTDKVKGDLNSLAEALTPVSQQMVTASEALTDTKAELQNLTTRLTSFHTDLKNLRSTIDDMQDSGDDLGYLLDDVEGMQSELNNLQSQLSSLKTTDIMPEIESPFGTMTKEQVENAYTQAGNLHAMYESVSADGVTFDEFAKEVLLAAGKSESEADQAIELHDAYPSAEVAAAQSEAAAATWTAVENLEAPYQAAGTMNNFETFVYGLLLAQGTDPTTAKTEAGQLSDLYDMYGDDTDGFNSLMENFTALNLLISTFNTTTDKVNSTVKGLASPTAALVDALATLDGNLDVFQDLLDEGYSLGTITKAATEKADSVLDSINNLDKIFNTYEPTAQETLKTIQTLSEKASSTVQDTGAFIGDLEALVQKSGTQLDSGTKKTLESLAEALRQTAKSTSKTKDVKSAKDNIDSIIRNTWDEHTGDTDNLLNMDSKAAAVSLTSASNPTPQSIQVLLRTQEIKVQTKENSQQAETKSDQGTFWSRVGRMFKDFWHSITGVFH